MSIYFFRMTDFFLLLINRSSCKLLLPVNERWRNFIKNLFSEVRLILIYNRFFFVKKANKKNRFTEKVSNCQLLK
jgi:hypothetical protein